MVRCQYTDHLPQHLQLLLVYGTPLLIQQLQVLQLIHLHQLPSVCSAYMILCHSITPTFTIGPSVRSTAYNNITIITGVWSPATINTATAGTTTYTFTPAAGQCALPFTMSIVITPEVTPTFTQLVLCVRIVLHHHCLVLLIMVLPVHGHLLLLIQQLQVLLLIHLRQLLVSVLCHLQ